MNTEAMKKAAKFCGFKTTLEYRKWLRSLRAEQAAAEWHQENRDADQAESDFLSNLSPIDA